MEGIEPTASTTPVRRRVSELEAGSHEWRLVERWLVFLFGVAIIGITVLGLCFAALSSAASAR